MANDGSIPSLVEDWIVAKIEGLAGVGVDSVEVFEGVEAFAGGDEELISELSRKPGILWVSVRWNGRRAEEIEQEDYDAVSTYIVYCVVRNRRPGASRRGDDTWKGTNWYSDQIFQLFTGTERRPNQNDGTFATERLKLVSQDVVQVFPKGFSMFHTILEVREVLIAP